MFRHINAFYLTNRQLRCQTVRSNFAIGVVNGSLLARGKLQRPHVGQGVGLRFLTGVRTVGWYFVGHLVAHCGDSTWWVCYQVFHYRRRYGDVVVAQVAVRGGFSLFRYLFPLFPITLFFLRREGFSQTSS